MTISDRNESINLMAEREMTNGDTIKLDPRMPAREKCILGPLLDFHAHRAPDKMFVKFPEGEQWTYADFRRRVRLAATGLQQHGVSRGQHVVMWLPNCPEALVLWFAVNYIGAVFVPLNIAYRGALLQHTLGIAKGVLMVVHSGLLDRLSSITVGIPEKVVVIGDRGACNQDAQFLYGNTLFEASGEPKVPDDIAPWDPQSIVFTSGTTGPSKGVVQSYFHQYCTAAACDFLRGDDNWLVTLPLFHQGGILAVYRVFVRGGSITLMESFKTQTFWETVRRTEVTGLTLLGTMANFLVKEPPSELDRRHHLRTVIMVPLKDAARFKQRFGPDVYTTYNMTEVSFPLISSANPAAMGTCGKVRDGVEARIVDSNDCEVAVGSVGELIVRTDAPWAFASEYYKDPEATAKAWRNGWFHTGDTFRCDTDGNHYFIDRVKDALRRRGENVSSFEVEMEIAAFPAVREVAVVGVPSEYSEDEILAIIAPVEGSKVDPSELLTFLTPRLAHFMIPRYVRVMDDLPKTASSKIQKHVLRSEGVTADTWDREKAGIRIRRDVLT